MAPNARSRSRQADYSNIGVTGRKTGAILKDTGVVDDQGLAPIDGIFSSPEKPRASSQKPSSSSNGKLTDNRTLTEEDMELTTNSLPEPQVMLSARRSIPRSRSPIKTSIGSPRKSVGPRSSPLRLSNGTPSRILPQDDPSTIVDISTEALAQSIESSRERLNGQRAEQSSPPTKIAKAKQLSKKGRNKRTFDISTDEDEELNNTTEDYAPPDATMDEEPLNGDNSLEIPPGGDGDDNDDDDDDDDVSQQLETEIASAAEKTTSKAVKGKRGRPKTKTDTKATNSKVAKSAPTEVREAEAEPPTNLGGSTANTTKKRRPGRPPKTKEADTARPAVYRDPDQSVEEGPGKPSKRAKTDSVPPPSSPSSKKRPPPSARDPNAQITSKKGNDKAEESDQSEGSEQPKNKAKDKKGKSKAKELVSMPPPPRPSSAASTTTSERGKPKPRSLQILRSATPAEADGARFTRSGRTTIKPIEFWRGERVVWTKPTRVENGRVSLPGIQEIVRAEDLPAEKRTRTPRTVRTGPRRRRRLPVEEEEEEEDADVEEWELDPGVLEGEVWQWDTKAERGSVEVLEQIDLAIAPKGLEALTKEVKNQTFEYAKTITLPFFHSGMVDIPPQGEKRTKNSRKNHMVFWVFAGRVVVDVSGNEFALGRGGMWQVPRGNTYSIANPFNTKARVFFAQGCYMTEEEGVEFEEEEAERQRFVEGDESGGVGAGAEEGDGGDAE